MARHCQPILSVDHQNDDRQWRAVWHGLKRQSKQNPNFHSSSNKFHTQYFLLSFHARNCFENQFGNEIIASKRRSRARFQRACQTHETVEWQYFLLREFVDLLLLQAYHENNQNITLSIRGRMSESQHMEV